MMALLATIFLLPYIDKPRLGQELPVVLSMSMTGVQPMPGKIASPLRQSGS